MPTMRPTVLPLALTAVLAACGPGRSPGSNPSAADEGSREGPTGPAAVDTVRYLVAASGDPGSVPAAWTVRIPGPGRVPLVTDVHDVPDAAAAVILFHQGGGSARGEYAFLVPWLTASGYAVVAPDLHGGGSRFGAGNRTLSETPEPDDWSYCDALPQVDAVVEWTRSRFPGTALVLWGSSYSGALVVRRAARDARGVAAVLAFSPAGGEPMAGCLPEAVAGEVDVPLLVVRPEAEAAMPSVREQLAAFRAAGHATWIAHPGAHGASTLHPERVEGGWAVTLQRVSDFLAEVVGRPLDGGAR